MTWRLSLIFTSCRGLRQQVSRCWKGGKPALRSQRLYKTGGAVFDLLRALHDSPVRLVGPLLWFRESCHGAMPGIRCHRPGMNNRAPLPSSHRFAKRVGKGRRWEGLRVDRRREGTRGRTESGECALLLGVLALGRHHRGVDAPHAPAPPTPRGHSRPGVSELQLALPALPSS